MSYVYTEDSPGVLVHYGRLGMHWGQHIFGDDPRWGRNSRGGKFAKEKAAGGSSRRGGSFGFREIRETQGGEKNLSKNKSNEDELFDEWIRMPVLADTPSFEEFSANPDRYRGGSSSRESKRATKKQIKQAHREYLEANKKRSILSDEELNTNIDRLQREQRLQQLTDSQISPGRSMVENVLRNVGRTALEGAAYGLSSYAALSLAKSILGDKTVEELAPGKQAVVSVLSTVSRNLDNKTRRK